MPTYVLEMPKEPEAQKELGRKCTAV